MPSDFNHIDEFFRSKEKEVAAPEHLQDRHWEQMKETLSSLPGTPSPVKKTGYLKTFGITGLVIATAAAVIFMVYKNNPVASDQKNITTTVSASPRPQTLATTNDSFPVTKRIILKQDTIQVRTNNMQIIQKAFERI